MQPNKSYIFKITYATGNRESAKNPSNFTPTVKVWFTKFAEHWSSSWGNVKYSFNMYPPVSSQGWVQHWEVLSDPGINLFANLNNIVLDCSGNHAYIDYVELAENCENPLLLENHRFTSITNELPYKSAGTLKAGFDVGNPNGNGSVVVENGADITFKAGDNIILEPGFFAEQGSNFTALIEPCDINTARVIEDTVDAATEQVIDDKTIRIGNITIYDDSRETLPCNDDPLFIYGLDGDTTSFVGYWWDYGNGVTSTNSVAKIEYDEPGEYLVKLALTDSSRVTDTLSKIYIKPDCSRLKPSGLNGNPNNIVSIYPNPTTGQIAIELGTIVSEVLVEIYDVMGKKVFAATTLENNLQIDISDQPKGIYLVRVVDGGKVVFTEKIIYQ